MKGDIRLQTGGVCPTAEGVAHLVVLARDIHNFNVELAEEFMPSAAASYRADHLVQILSVPVL